MKIFFCAALNEKSMSGWQRAQSLKELGYQLDEFRQDSYTQMNWATRLSVRLRKDVFDRKAIEKFNRDILVALCESRPDVAWIEKALMLLPETLVEAKKKLPGCIFVCFQDDDPFGPRKFELRYWVNFIEAIPFFDIHFVKKSVDITEFQQRGAVNVFLFTSGFYRGIFHPIEYDKIPLALRNNVMFVGTALDHRVEMIAQLIKKHGIPVNVYGNRWNRKSIFYRARKQFHPPVTDYQYVKAICGAKISLGFVSSSNRDEYSMRTFEIPACGCFLLAERTPRHIEFFEEGKEAEFFDSIEELADKINFYLQNEMARLRIAKGGYLRCLASNYSLHERLTRALKQIETLRKGGALRI